MTYWTAGNQSEALSLTCSKIYLAEVGQQMLFWSLILAAVENCIDDMKRLSVDVENFIIICVLFTLRSEYTPLTHCNECTCTLSF